MIRRIQIIGEAVRHLSHQLLSNELLRSDPPQEIHDQRVNVRIRKFSVGNQKSIVNRAVKTIDHDVEIESAAEFACLDAR